MRRIYRLAFRYSMAKNNTLHIEEENEHMSIWGSGHPSLFRRWIICVILLTGQHFWLGIKMLKPRFIYSNNASQKRISFFSTSRKKSFRFANVQTHKDLTVTRLPSLTFSSDLPSFGPLLVFKRHISFPETLKPPLNNSPVYFPLAACPLHQLQCLYWQFSQLKTKMHHGPLWCFVRFWHFFPFEFSKLRHDINVH